MVYYNEIDPFAVEWLKALISEGLIADGDVDSRSIEDVKPNDLAGYTQCHFFAGIGGWSYALRLSGWPDGRPVWTISCPCQPFSAAGKGAGMADERHLWPAAHWLIAQRRPLTIFGEQVASKDGLAWLDLVQDDLERTAYSSGAVDICAAGIGAPHIRQRLYWRANSASTRYVGEIEESKSETWDKARMLMPSSNVQLSERDDGVVTRLEERTANSRDDNSSGWLNSTARRSASETGATRGFWSNCDWWHGRDEKFRPIEPGLFPLAHGVSGRVGKLRGYGNAIVPELAAEFIKASEGL